MVEAAKPPLDYRPSPLSARTTAAPPCAQALSQRERGHEAAAPPHCTVFPCDAVEVMLLLGGLGGREGPLEPTRLS